MKIYLAGKMDAEHGAWRDALLDSRYDKVAERTMPTWVLTRDMGDQGWEGDRICMPWPRQPNKVVMRLHDYVGPYRTSVKHGQWESKYMGDFHGSDVRGCHGQTNGEDDALIVNECIEAIRRADLVFAYVNSPDCFGTLAEIGLAKAFGAYVVAGFEMGAEWDWSDYWFIAEMVDVTVRVPPPIEVGPRPVFLGPEQWKQPALGIQVAWEKRKEAEDERIRGLLKEAIFQWTARPEKPSPVALVRHDETEPYIRALQEAATSLSQIARWSADPRVRNEAQRMLKRISG